MPTVVASILLWALAQIFSSAALVPAIVLCGVLALAWWVAAIVVSVRTPSRGIAERLSGTYLVME